MRDATGKLWIQTCITTSFRSNILCVLPLIIRKLHVIYRCCIDWTTPPISELMSIFWVRAGYKIRLVRYVSKHSFQFLSGKSFVCPFTNNLQTTSHVWMFSISNDCSTIEDILCLGLSRMRDPTRKPRPQTPIDRSLLQHFVHILQACTYLAVWCASTHDNKNHVPYDCILHTNLHYTMLGLLNQSCMLILKLLRGTTVYTVPLDMCYYKIGHCVMFY